MRYEQFLDIVKAWQYAKLMKRSGRAHDPLGVEATAEGECALPCPACPHPGINAPEDLSKVDEDQR
jgi:hypothetical protein